MIFIKGISTNKGQFCFAGKRSRRIIDPGYRNVFGLVV